jgi:hypothetical protein
MQSLCTWTPKQDPVRQHRQQLPTATAGSTAHTGSRRGSKCDCRRAFSLIGLHTLSVSILSLFPFPSVQFVCSNPTVTPASKRSRSIQSVVHIADGGSRYAHSRRVVRGWLSFWLRKGREGESSLSLCSCVMMPMMIVAPCSGLSARHDAEVHFRRLLQAHHRLGAQRVQWNPLLLRTNRNGKNFHVRSIIWLLHAAECFLLPPFGLS